MYNSKYLELGHDEGNVNVGKCYKATFLSLRICMEFILRTSHHSVSRKQSVGIERRY